MKKSRFRFLIMMLITVLCCSSSSFAVFAEDVVVANEEQNTFFATEATTTAAPAVTYTNYSLAGKYISFTWNKVEDYSGKDIVYALRMWKNSDSYSSDNKVILKEGLTDNKYNSTTGLLRTNTYRYQVVSYYSDATPDWTGATTTTISLPAGSDLPAPTEFTAKFKYSSKAKNTKKLGEIVQKDNTISIKWTVADPTLYSHFDVIRVSSSGSTKKLGSVNASADKTEYTYIYYSPKGTYSYKLRLFSNTEQCKCVYNQTDVVQGPNVKGDYLTTNKVQTNNTWSAVAQKKTTLYKSPGGSKYKTVPKGTSMDATGEYSPDDFEFWDTPTWVEVEYNDDYYWVKWSQVKMKWHLTYKDYAWSVKEDFVNNHDYDSNTKYLIWVSRFANRTNVFKKEKGKWVLKKVYDCNTGNFYQPLKGGQYYIKGHEAIKYKIHENGREYYFRYSTKFGGSGTFHTRCRWVDTGGLRNAIKRHPTTKGCCRLYDAAAKYIYGLPNGTGVIIK